MSSHYKLYFDVVHKVIIPKKERCSEASYFDLTLIELLDLNVPINVDLRLLWMRRLLRLQMPIKNLNRREVHYLLGF